MDIGANILKQFGLDSQRNTYKNKDQNKYKNINNNRNQKDQNRNRNQHDHGSNEVQYVGAPYNFVPFSKNVQPYPNALPKLNDTCDDLISGSISYELGALTDISVGGQNDGNTVHSYVNCYGNLAIPGSSVRGLVRSNAQILSLSSFDDDIEDGYLMYRDMAKNGNLRKTYTTILGSNQDGSNGHKMTVNRNVRAGYLVHNKDGKFHLYKTELHLDSTEDEGLPDEINYYIISEKFIIEHPEEFQYLYSSDFGKNLQYKEKTEFVKLDRGGFDCKKGDGSNGGRDENYVPFVSSIRFNTNEKKRVTGIYSPNGNKGSLKGCLVGTGFVPRKKALYIIPAIDYNHEVEVSEEQLEKAVSSFRTDYNRKENTLRKNCREFFQLPKEGAEPKPVFYILHDGRFYFGYTPNLRLFFKHSVKEGLQQDKVDMDYCAALFGYANDQNARKSRISFSDAIITDRSIKETKEYSYVLAEPKPTSYRDYLDNGKTYNDDDLRLRGVKQYWIHDHIMKPDPSENEKIKSHFTAIPAGSILKGKVRFHNLTREELGLLLWSIELDPDTKQNIGKAKPYGFGAFSVKITGMEKENHETAYSLNSFSASPFTDILNQKKNYEKIYQDALVKWYASRMNNKKKVLELKDIPPIKTLMEMKSISADDNLTRYMNLNEYQKRRKDLPSAEEMMKKMK